MAAFREKGAMQMQVVRSMQHLVRTDDTAQFLIYFLNILSLQLSDEVSQ